MQAPAVASLLSPHAPRPPHTAPLAVTGHAMSHAAPTWLGLGLGWGSGVGLGLGVGMGMGMGLALGFGLGLGLGLG